MTISKIGETNLFIGNGNDARDITKIQQIGIKSIVNVALDLEGPWFLVGTRHYKIGLLDGPGNKLFEYVAAAQLILDCLRQGQKVLVHCHAGQSRSPAIAIIALSILVGKPTAEQLVAQFRPQRNIHPAHIPFIDQAISQLK